MRDVVFWLSGAALAFLLTAGAFLFLANLATVPSEKRLNPDQAGGGSGQAVDLILDRERLASLESLPDQSLALVVENEGGEQLSSCQRDPESLLGEHSPFKPPLLQADGREDTGWRGRQGAFRVRPSGP